MKAVADSGVDGMIMMVMLSWGRDDNDGDVVMGSGKIVVLKTCKAFIDSRAY